ncbi:flagellar hook capping FlgD N-terminal domain-containing protein [Mangrovicoccus algicola]|uniref:Basal-body rod modification protein FlgD n=1 Tax=Mangrovicoccus algicola TaxID=2771008 RepID=A0A8J6YX68_9RHOB|nr:flagellar hook capping FlgD N-terminal domain-containing protein [Mangrovicoccus algicola]MBE3639277.1 flagellar hook assembly protein FlgD [Mangrovicoccus algicola]
MTIDNIQAVQPATTATAGSTGTAGGEGTISSDFTTFLRMLTAQIQNQDPLNPMDSADFAVQLATFSGVEQQVLTNELLGSIRGGLGGAGQLDTLAAWVGKEAGVASLISFDGEPVALDLPQGPGDAARKLLIRDGSGQVVRRVDVSAQAQAATWNGRTENGQRAPEGVYLASLQSVDPVSGEVTEAAIVTYSAIREMRRGADGAEALLANGATVAVDDITSLRDPAPLP